MISKTLKVSEAKSRFSEALAAVADGETVSIVKGQQQRPIAKIVTYNSDKPKKIEFGGLKKYGNFSFSDSWEMTEEEFLGL
jgi:antitoxin (DNA-binding transcriptional repressor) of toxin-antitoxin stability system